MKKRYLLSAMLAGMVLFSGQTLQTGQAEKKPLPVKITMINQQGKVSGFATLTQTEMGLNVEVNVRGLQPGVHGIHFHENGSCIAPTFDSAGGHFNPEHKEHGLKNPMGPHAGDLKNVVADRNGVLQTNFMTSRVTLQKGVKDSLRDANGSALVIHAQEDDQKTNPAGNSGQRVMCGVIK